MSQEHQENNRKSRRAARAQRPRPVLVTTKKGEEIEQTTPITEKLAVKTGPLATEPEIPASQPRRRLPNFFSSVGKKETQSAEVDVAQARLARATRTKVSATKTTASKEGTQEDRLPLPTDSKKSEVRATPTKTSQASARPASPFKTRYILGMAIYLICAQFIGYLETGLLQSMKWDILITNFSLFGLPIRVTTSTLTFLATLIIILVILAKFDLIPRNLSALGGAPPAKSTQSQSRGNQESASVKTTTPSMRQGVKGSDDQLYQAYRANQRREKKR